MSALSSLQHDHADKGRLYLKVTNKILLILILLTAIFLAGCNDNLNLNLVRKYFNITHLEMSDSQLAARFKEDQELLETVRIAVTQYEHGQAVSDLLDGKSNRKKRADTVRKLFVSIDRADKILNILNMAGLTSTKIFPIPYLGQVVAMGAGTWALAVDLIQSIEEDFYRNGLKAYIDMRNLYGSGEECINQVVLRMAGTVPSSGANEDTFIYFFQYYILRDLTGNTKEEIIRSNLNSMELDYNAFMFYKDRNAHEAVKRLILGLEDIDRRVKELNICEVWSASSSGGYGTTVDEWDISELPRGAHFDLKFNTYRVPDRITIYYQGSTVYDSGWRGQESYVDNNPHLYPGGLSGPGEGQMQGIFTKDVNDTFTVTVYGPESSTKWNYQMKARCRN